MIGKSEISMALPRGGGPYGVGTAFKLTRRSPIMQWQKSILHNFGEGVDGVYPWLGLVFDAAGNL